MHPSRFLATAALAAVALACGTSGNTPDGGAPLTDAGDAGGSDDQSDAGGLLCPVYDAGGITADQIDAGYVLIEHYGCQKCHGAVLSGNPDGVQDPLSGVLAYPPDLTPDQDAGLGCWTDAQIENAILNNVNDRGEAICQPMPNFADAGMTVEQAQAIIWYLRAGTTDIYDPVPTEPTCCLYDLDCGDNGYCFQRECVDGGAPLTATGSSGATSGAASTGSVAASAAASTGTSGASSSAAASSSSGASATAAATSSATASSSSGASTTGAGSSSASTGSTTG